MCAEYKSIPDALSPVIHVTTHALKAGELGAVVARPGVGKTSFLVQVALHTMMSGKKVMHVNLKDSIKKVTLWYGEIFSLLCKKHQGLEEGVVLDSLLARRFIMTMQVQGFSTDAIGERLADLLEQNIFTPDILIIDGLSFDASRQETVDGLGRISREFFMGIWVSVPAHREEPRDDADMPARIGDIKDHFALVWEFVPEGQEIRLKQLVPEGADTKTGTPDLCLDPASMLLDVRAA
ncbi:MAG: AAA family ATPase [Thermodesulfobacteriota bacterium]|nr:AAA family ATPase [Thermodesulfobacteriota bacterium]